MDVNTLKPHGNPHGKAWQKKEGDVYTLPDNQAPGLIAQGLVEQVAPAEAPEPVAKIKPGKSGKAGNAGDADAG